jgi:hypothetical protein
VQNSGEEINKAPQRLGAFSAAMRQVAPFGHEGSDPYGSTALEAVSHNFFILPSCLSGDFFSFQDAAEMFHRV